MEIQKNLVRKMLAIVVALLAALLFGGRIGGWMGSFFAPPGELGAGVAHAAIGGVCAVCHSSVVSRSDLLPHGRSGGVEGWKPLKCEECHPVVKGHASRTDAQNSPERCGKCHFAGGDAKKGQAKQLPQKLLLGKTEWERSRHQAAKLGCTRCHNVHNPGARPLLARSSTSLCLECHGQVEKHKKLKAIGEVAVRDNCTACHDPHGGKKNTLPSKQASPWEFKRKYVHWPVAQGMCDSCHSPHLPSAGRGETGQEDGASGVSDLLVTPVGEICYACHGDKQEPITKIAHGYLQTEGANRQNSCLTCHTPHSSDFGHLTVYESNRLCLGCHANKTPHHFLTVRLDVRSKLKCVNCHEPHGNGNRALLKQTQSNLCLQCHNM